MHEQKLLDNLDGWHGSELSLIIAGNWQYYRAKVVPCTGRAGSTGQYRIGFGVCWSVCLVHLVDCIC